MRKTTAVDTTMQCWHCRPVQADMTNNTLVTIVLTIMHRRLCLLQAAVIGLSCRHDVMELLEKRVRSRFSHRKHLIPDLQEQDFAVPGDSPGDVLSNMLTVHEQQPNASTCVGTSTADQAVQQWNAAVDDVMKGEAVLGQLKLMVNQGDHTF